jgi:PKD repeat protein
MNKKPYFLTLGRALLFAALSVSAGSALATATFGTRADNYCASRPIQASAPQQSRPYRAANFACTLCHTSASNPSANNLNAFGNASLTCTSTTCGAAMNPFCVATPPGSATITAPAAGTTVAQGQSLTFTAGNPANPDGFPLSFTWMFSGGMPNATGQSVSVPMTVAGSITSTLQVRNSVGMLATGTPPTRTVTVTGGGGNQPPVATIGAPTGNVTIARGGTVTFQGSGTDPDGNTPLTYSWNFGGGAPNSTQQNPGAVTFNTAGTFTVTFTVTDSLGLSSTPVTRTITVTGAGANQPPVATISAPADNETILQGGTVTFQGSGSDPDGNTPLSYSWNFGGGAPNSTVQNPGAVTFNTAGTFTVTFTVTDSLGLSSAPVTRMVTVTATPPGPVPGAPVATIIEPAGNVTIVQGGTVTFRGAGMVSGVAGGNGDDDDDDDGDNRRGDDDDDDDDDNGDNGDDDNGNGNNGGSLAISAYNWNFGGGAPDSTQQNPGAVTFNTVGTFTVTFTVTDSLGRVSAPVTRIVTVTAAPQRPVANIVTPAMNVSVLPGGTVNFSGSGTGDRITYRWQFPGGTPGSSTRQNPGAVRFTSPGSYTVRLTVTDRRGRASDPVTRVVTVAMPNQAPRVDEDCVDGRRMDDGRDRDDDDRDRDRRRNRDRDDD